MLMLITLALLAYPTDDLAQARAAADRAWTARDWEKTAEACRRVTGLAPDDAVHWHRLGYALHSLGRLDEAMTAHRKAIETAKPDQVEVHAKAAYNVACVHARKGETDLALEWLGRTAEAGYTNTDMWQYDEDLKSLREEPRFRELVARLEAKRRRVAIVIHEGVELLDFSGPAEVFSAARAKLGSRYYHVSLVGPEKKPYRCQNVHGTVTPELSIAECPQPDVLVIPGGATQNLLRDPKFMAWVKEVAPKAQVVFSVCTGAFVLTQAGLLEGKAATTHHRSLAGLRSAHPGIDVREGVRFVDNGQVVTAGGVAAGIDGALQVVRNQCGEETARQTARYLEHPWPARGEAVR